MCQTSASPVLSSTALAKKISFSTVLIKGVSGSVVQSGSGVIVSSDGKIATNLHVIRGLDKVGVQLPTGEVFDDVTVTAFDARKDLAILQIAGFDLPVAELGNSNDVEVGESVLLIGNPMDLHGTVTAGIISAIRDDPEGHGYKILQTDAAMNPGNSGGAVVNAKGQVIGIAVAKLRDSQGLNFAIPVNYLRGLLSNLQKPMSLAQMNASLTGTTDVFAKTVAVTRWKSMTSGTTKILRLSGDHLFVETVLPADLKARGDFAIADLKKVGGKYIGRSKHSFVCSYQKVGWPLNNYYSQNNSHRCSVETEGEITLFGEDRIEGRFQEPHPGSKFNCKKCDWETSFEWAPFVWIPE